MTSDRTRTLAVAEPAKVTRSTDTPRRLQRMQTEIKNIDRAIAKLLARKASCE